jgi:saccharopine dehydrogenase (NAD+, L-lysine-forming)
MDGRQVVGKSFEDGKKAFFGSEFGWRTAYCFNFADQQVLQRTLQVPEVSTRFCLDSALITESIALLKRTGFLSLLPLSLSVHLLRKLKIGKPVFVVKVEGKNQNSKLETLIRGEQEASVTATVASFIAAALYEKTYPHGVYHSEELFEWEIIYQQLADVIVWDKDS